jgi:hypothetical protein
VVVIPYRYVVPADRQRLLRDGLLPFGEGFGRQMIGQVFHEIR